MFKIVAIKVENREEAVTKVQSILTENGCLIKVRLGLHDVNQAVCTSAGLILLEVFGDNAKIQEMVDSLNNLEGVTTNYFDI